MSYHKVGSQDTSMFWCPRSLRTGHRTKTGSGGSPDEFPAPCLLISPHCQDRRAPPPLPKRLWGDAGDRRRLAVSDMQPIFRVPQGGTAPVIWHGERIMIFTDVEVEEINRYQKSGKFHPLTCGNGHGTLIATNDGLICPECDYRQTMVPWWIKNGSWDVHEGENGCA